MCPRDECPWEFIKHFHNKSPVCIHILKICLWQSKPKTTLYSSYLLGQIYYYCTPHFLRYKFFSSLFALPQLSGMFLSQALCIYSLCPLPPSICKAWCLTPFLSLSKSYFARETISFKMQWYPSLPAHSFLFSHLSFLHSSYQPQVQHVLWITLIYCLLPSQSKHPEGRNFLCLQTLE